MESDIHVRAVWLIADDGSIRTCRALLSREERDRADRFACDRLRNEYQIAHGALRLFAADYIGCLPHQLQLRSGRRGKPEFKVRSEIRLNLAHSQTLALYAFVRGCEVGIDVENVRPRVDLEQVAKLCFCEAEIAELLSLPTEEDRLEAFFCCWTRKEAYVKAVGDGLFLPLDQFQVTLCSSVPARFVHIGFDTQEAEAWQLHHVEPAPDHVGAVAYRGECRKVRIFPPIMVSDLLGHYSTELNQDLNAR
jgi:4'-phosphopantetheinyl transferase